MATDPAIVQAQKNKILSLQQAALDANKSDLATAIGVLGYDPTPAYKAYVQAWSADDPAGLAGAPPSFNQWTSDTIRVTGTSGVANLIKSQYELQTGQTMPQSVWDQVVSTVRGLPQSTQQQMMQAIEMDLIPPGTGTGQTGKPAGVSLTTGGLAGANLAALVGKIGPLQNLLYSASGGTVGSQALTPAQAAQQSHENSVRNAYLAKFGHVPSDAQVKQMAGMNESDLQNFYNNQQYKLGLTYGQWQVAQGNIDSQYMKYFGRNATDQEIAWANGKSADDIQSHIMDSPSRVDGLSMGQYTNYKSALDDESTKMFGYAAPDEMIKAFHTATLGQHAGV